MTSPATGRRAAITTTPIPGTRNVMDEGPRKAPRRSSWRNLVRIVHSVLGNLSGGPPSVWALSGRSVNHIADWDRNFHNYERTHELGGPIQGDDNAAADVVLRRLDVKDKPREVYRAAPQELEIVFKER